MISANIFYNKCNIFLNATKNQLQSASKLNTSLFCLIPAFSFLEEAIYATFKVKGV